MTPAETIDYLRGTASNLDGLVGRDPDTDEGAIDEDIALEGVEALEMVDKLRDAADEVERMQRQVEAYQEWSRELAAYVALTHKPGIVDDASVAILDGYHIGLTPVAGPPAGGENTLAAALRLLKLAKDRGAFNRSRADVNPDGLIEAYALPFSKRLMRLAADVFDLAADRMPDNVCADFETPPDLTDDELRQLADLLDLANMGSKTTLAQWRAMHPEDATAADDIRETMTSWVLAGAMAYLVRQLAEGKACSAEARERCEGDR